jgi:hypothetical protein
MSDIIDERGGKSFSKVGGVRRLVLDVLKLHDLLKQKT